MIASPYGCFISYMEALVHTLHMYNFMIDDVNEGEMYSNLRSKAVRFPNSYNQSSSYTLGIDHQYFIYFQFYGGLTSLLPIQLPYEPLEAPSHLPSVYSS